MVDVQYMDTLNGLSDYHSKTARYCGVHVNTKYYPPPYQFYVTADFRDYTAWISANKRGGTLHIEVLQGARLSLNGFSHHRFSQDSLAFSAILWVNGIGRSMAKTIVTIAI